IDSFANAAVLYKQRRSYFEYNTSGFNIVSEYFYRIKIYNAEGFDWGTVNISTSIGNGIEETIFNLKAATYNLENNSIVTTKLSKKDIFKEEVDKYTLDTKFTLPNLKDGSVIEYKYKVVSPFVTYMDEVVLQYDIPINKVDIKISLLDYFKFNTKTKGFVFLNIKEGYKRNRDLDTRDKLYEIYDTNIPALPNEAYVNNIKNYRAGIVFELASIEIPGSTYELYATDWDSVTKKIYQSSSFGGELKKVAFLKDDIALLKTQNKTLPEKIVAALEFVKAKVKWNGYYGKTSDNGVKKAYKEGTGNIADINLLLVSVLREMGISSNPVLVSTRANGIPLHPTNKGLNYVIAAVELNEQVVLLDATEQYSAPDILPLRALNWKGRIVRKSGSSTWIDLLPKKIAKINSTIQIILDDQGYSEGLNMSKYINNEALKYRKKYANLNDDEIALKIEENNEIIEIEEFKLNNKHNAYKPVVELYKFSSDEMVENTGQKMYIKPLIYNSITENPFKLAERHFPIDYTSPFIDNNNISITIPEGYKVESVPETLGVALPNNYGVYKFKTTVVGNVIKVYSILQINTAIYPATHYSEIKEFYNKIVNKHKERIILTKA
ncbi:MAG TPA: hypothetical protein VJ970_06920, partial [Flavobacteriaceae bacterium]|nr:hypothetical protein [Flavobacteriaceae bacterium]